MTAWLSSRTSNTGVPRRKPVLFSTHGTPAPSNEGNPHVTPGLWSLAWRQNTGRSPLWHAKGPYNRCPLWKSPVSQSLGDSKKKKQRYSTIGAAAECEGLPPTEKPEIVLTRAGNKKKRKRKRKGELGVWSQGWLYSNVFLECKEISVPCVDVRTILVLRAYSWVCRPWDAAPTSKCIQIDGQTDREQRQLRGVRDSRSHSQRQAEVRGHRGECLTLLLYLLPVKEISVYYKVFALESDSSAVQSKVWNTSTYIRARTTVLSTPPPLRFIIHRLCH